MVQLKPVTVQQHSRQPVDSSVRIQLSSRQSSYILVKVKVNQSKIPLYTVQLEPVDNSATFKISRRQISQTLLIVQQHSVLLIDLSQNHLNSVKIQVKFSTQKQPGCKKRCGPVQIGQCEKSCEIKGGIQADGKNFNNTNSGKFCADSLVKLHGMRQHKLT